MTKIKLLLEWARERGIFSSVDIHNYKTNNYHLAADRDIRHLTNRGYLIRLTEEEIVEKGLRIKEQAKIGFWKAIK